MPTTYTIEYEHDKKTYSGGGKSLVVWSLQGCLTKLRKAKAEGDHELKDALVKLAAWREGLPQEQMTQDWANDCQRIWLEAFDMVLMEPEAPKQSLFAKKDPPKSLFNRS